MQHTIKIAIMALVATAGSLAACSQTSSPGSAAPTVTQSPASTQLPFGQACTQEVLLPMLQSRFDDQARALVIERVDIRRCRDGYAHVFAVTALDPSGQAEYENEQLFLHFDGAQWQSVSEGTGVSCSDADNPPDLAAACRALGYHYPETPRSRVHEDAATRFLNGVSGA